MKQQEIEKDIQICRSIGMPRNRARRSFSRIATRVRPNGEREQQALQAGGNGEDDQQEIVKCRVMFGDVDAREAEVERRAGEATQAVVSAGKAVPAIGNVERDLAETRR